MECSICCEKFNKSNNLKVECKGCTEENYACRNCCKSYLLNNDKDHDCMFCKCKWDREFMNKYLTKKFVQSELKIQKSNVFIDNQISLLPETQKDAVVEKKIREINSNLNECLLELERLERKKKEQKDIISNFRLQIHRLTTGEGISNMNANNFTVKCPAKDCNGFLNDKYYCELCETKFCRQCMEKKDLNHVCDEQIKASVQAIKKESKPCPGCGEMISKIDGCDQMWCIKCHIQFSWKDGRQLNGYNHNPEYFRWMRETGSTIQRNPMDGCGDYNIRYYNDRLNWIFAEYSLILEREDRLPKRDSADGGLLSEKAFDNVIKHDYLWKLLRLRNHIQGRTNEIERNEGNNNEELKRLRIKYILGDINREEWRLILEKLEKKFSKENLYNNVWRLANEVLTNRIDILYEKDNCKVSYMKKCDIAYEESKKFIAYINKTFMNISGSYDSMTCPGIDPNTLREIPNFKRWRLEQMKHVAERAHMRSAYQGTIHSVEPWIAFRFKKGSWVAQFDHDGQRIED